MREARGLSLDQLAREMLLDRLGLASPMRLLFEPSLDTAALRSFSSLGL